MIYNESVVFVEHEVNGETLRDPYNISRVVSLGDIVNVVKKRPLENDSVLILSVHLTVDNLSEAAQFVDFFARCHRLVFGKCTGDKEIVIPLIEAAAEYLRSGKGKWSSLELVPMLKLSEEDDEFREQLADALESFSTTASETFAQNDFHCFGLPKGIWCYIPQTRQVCIDLFTEAYRLKKLIYGLYLRPDEKKTAFQHDTEYVFTEFSLQNPLLHFCAALEKSYLPKINLFAEDSIQSALRAGWKDYIMGTLDIWLKQLLLLDGWISSFHPGRAEESIQVIPRLVDEAVVYLLKMRPSKRRAGIDVVPVVREALRNHDWERLLPITKEYAIEKKLF